MNEKQIESFANLELHRMSAETGKRPAELITVVQIMELVCDYITQQEGLIAGIALQQLWRKLELPNEIDEASIAKLCVVVKTMASKASKAAEQSE